MVVALDDLPPLLWHAELGRSLPDVWTGRRQRGVQLHRLRDAVTTWEDRYGQRAWLRQLQGGEIGREHEDRLMEVIDRFDGHPFPTTARLAGRWAAGRFRRRAASLETIYCAELVATTYRRWACWPAPSGLLVRPGPVLERRPPRARAALLARRRDRGVGARPARGGERRAGRGRRAGSSGDVRAGAAPRRARPRLRLPQRQRRSAPEPPGS